MKHLVEPIKNREDVSRIEKYLNTKNERDGLIFVFGINTGLRVSDILNLNVSDVKNKTYVEIREKKTKKYKRFPLNNKIRELLNEYLADKDINAPLFVGKSNKRLHRSIVYRFLNNACKEINLPVNAGTHTMRKTFGYHHYKKFNDIALLQKILNHSSPSITLRYISITQEEIDYSYNNFEL